MRIHLLIYGLCTGCCLPVSAQLCQGRPGPVIYQEAFGSGPNDGPALAPGVTTYNYGAIWPGNYRVTNITGVNGDAWHTSPDHTPGDVDGYMLLFDASVDAGLFFQKQLDSLCSNSRYEFSCWVMNVTKSSDCAGNSIPPDILFELRNPVSGDVLGQTTTGPIPATTGPVWGRYAITFFLPPGLNSVLVRLINNAPGGCGNDLAIDDFSFRLCSPETVQQVTICAGESFSAGSNVYTLPGVYTERIPIDQSCNDSTVVTYLSWFNSLINQYVVLCRGESVQVGNNVYSETGTYLDTIELPSCDSFITTVVVTGDPDTIRQTVRLCAGGAVWVGNQSYTQPGVYRDTLNNRFGCDSIVVTTLEVGDPFVVNAEPENTTLELGETVQFQGVASGQAGVVWNWTPPQGLSCSDCPDPLARPLVSTDYIATATDTVFGCFAGDTLSIRVHRCNRIFVPNVFAPDLTGQNDRFTLFSGPCVSVIRLLQVYDRWGNLVFDRRDFPANEPSMGWNGETNGRRLDAGVYVYIAEIELLDGFRQQYSGDITLMR